MRVLCLNCNRGSSRISGEILEKNADIILLQEWISHKTDQSAIAQDLLNSLGEISSTIPTILSLGIYELYDLLAINKLNALKKHFHLC